SRPRLSNVRRLPTRRIPAPNPLRKPRAARSGSARDVVLQIRSKTPRKVPRAPGLVARISKRNRESSAARVRARKESTFL
ncbi:MAG: hypothetical protein BJ554DRAFT_7927, partial [Olpidium bornovanus]